MDGGGSVEEGEILKNGGSKKKRKWASLGRRKGRNYRLVMGFNLISCEGTYTETTSACSTQRKREKL